MPIALGFIEVLSEDGIKKWNNYKIKLYYNEYKIMDSMR